MNVRKYIISFLILLSMFIISPAESAEGRTEIRITGSSSAVDISDILSRKSGTLSESDIKKICADITGRYHDRGYTAFYIEKAVMNSDGTADIIFKEAVVSEIKVSGMGEREGDAAESIFTKGELFNEFILKENISLTRKRFNLKRLNVTVKRGGDGNIVLSAVTAENIHELDTAVYGSPVYGVRPALAYRLRTGGILAGVSGESSFNQTDRSYSRGAVFFNSDNEPGNSYFSFSADVFDKKDSYDNSDDLIYRHKSLSPKAGYTWVSGAAAMGLFLAGTFDKLDDYPRENGGASFYGMQIKLSYNDSPYKIRYDDITTGEAGFSSGWNNIEERFSSRLTADYMINFSLFTGIFISLNGHIFYTTDDERFSHVYVFDNLIPCRTDDYTSASWRNISGIDLNYEVFKRTLYFAPVFKWGIYGTGSTFDPHENVSAAGAKLFYTSGKIRLEALYLYDTGDSFKKGILMFSAAAVY
ncbi:MAG: hypothetical protein CVV49_04420 [Spirochaetae bacterium HGW-Spirochaetae-5]|nr:MAG: hypothetical protein CVV49_04420 [Spirochaetae bacterium HGW-Spirochaetae-5]